MLEVLLQTVLYLRFTKQNITSVQAPVLGKKGSTSGQVYFNLKVVTTSILDPRLASFPGFHPSLTGQGPQGYLHPSFFCL